MCTRCMPGITIPQQDLILQEIERQFPREYPLFGLQDELGLRLSEGLALTVQDVSGTNVLINKVWTGSALASTMRPRTLEVSDRLGNRLSAEINDLSGGQPSGLSRAVFLFADIKTGKPYARCYLINRVWLVVLKRLNIAPTPMVMLRHNAIRRLFRNLPPNIDRLKRMSAPLGFPHRLHKHRHEK